MLPSQSPRPVLLRTGVGRPRRRRRSLLVKVTVLGGVLVGTWLLIGAILPDRSNADGDRLASGDGNAVSAQPVAHHDDQDWRAAAIASQTRNEEEASSTVPDRSRSANRDSDPSGAGNPPAQQPPQTELVMGGMNPDPSAATSTSSTTTTSASPPLASADPAEPPMPSRASDPEPEPDTAAQARHTPQSAVDPRTLERMQKGYDLIASNRLVEARLMLSRALASGALNRADAELVRKTLTELNDRIIFSPEIFRDDEYSVQYTVASGDSLERIVRRMALQVDWRFIQRINRISNPRNIRVGDRLKLITGPFHAVVDKNDFSLDLYLGDGENQVYVRTFRVGLGEYNSTPIGLFRVRPNSKLINPEWINPRTRERFAAEDPNNPIGEHWIGLEGITEAVRDLSGYGIHGTIEPHTIGTQASMGCVRMHAEDVALIYEVLAEGASTVRIQQ